MLHLWSGSYQKPALFPGPLEAYLLPPFGQGSGVVVDQIWRLPFLTVCFFGVSVFFLLASQMSTLCSLRLA